MSKPKVKRPDFDLEMHDPICKFQTPNPELQSLDYEFKIATSKL